MADLDESMLQQVLQGDEAAFGNLYLAMVDQLFRYAKGRYQLTEQELNDCIADCFVKLRRALDTISNPESVVPYLWSVFKNTLKDYFKKHKLTAFSTIGDSDFSIEETLVSPDDVTELFAQEFDYERIIAAMQHLPTEDYDIIYRKYIEEQSTAVIAQRTDTTNIVVRKRLSRALSKLKTLLNGDDE